MEKIYAGGEELEKKVLSFISFERSSAKRETPKHGTDCEGSFPTRSFKLNLSAEAHNV